MSLLLDALKRAEQEKLARQPASSAGPASHAARPASAPGGGSLELQPIAAGGVGAPHAPHAQHPPHAPAAGRSEANAYAAQNAFQAKAADPESARNRTVLWVMFGAIALVAIAAAAYVWYSVKSLSPPQHAGGTPRPRAAPTPPPASGAPLPPTAAMGSIVPAPGTGLPPAVTNEQAAPAATATSPSSTTPGAPPAGGSAPSAPALAAETTGERLARAATRPAPPPVLMDRAPDNVRRVPAEVSAGYAALRQGDLTNARRAYEAALASDPTNIDAHLGLATIAARTAGRAAASEHYRRALDLDPRNSTALAGLASLAEYSRPDALEEQLRADLARHPESAALQLTLGNLHAAQGRWSEAQTAYFEAHRLDPGSAEISHNLAVSLDHLGQRRPAANFYRRALEAARGRAAPFDTTAVARRIAELD